MAPWLLIFLVFTSQLAHAEGQNCGFYFRVFSENSTFGHAANRLITATATAFPNIRKLNEAYKAALADTSPSDTFTKLLQKLDIRVSAAGDGLQRIPQTGGVVAVANHPFGFADGASMMALLHSVRPDVKVLMFDILAVDGLKEKIIPIRLTGDKAARKRANAESLRQAEQWLRNGHALVIFPAGRVASYAPGTRTVVESEWREGAARLALAAGAQVLPVFIPGQNSDTFHQLRKLNSFFGTARLPAEVIRMGGQTVEMHVGDAVSAATIREWGNDATARLRQLNEKLREGAIQE